MLDPTTPSLTEIQAGEVMKFCIRLCYGFSATAAPSKDLYIWAMRSGGFRAYMTGPTPLEAQQSTDEEGSFFFQIQPIVAGKYVMSITLGARHIDGSPFTCHVVAGPTLPENTEVTGIGLLCGETGQQTSFLVRCRDRIGNRRAEGGDDVQGFLTGPIALDCRVTDNANGSYTVMYSTLICGDYQVFIKVNNRVVPSCPLLLSVVAGKTYGPSSYCSGDGLQRAVGGIENFFTIQAQDVAGNPRILGGDDFKVVIDGPQTVEGRILDYDNGTYRVEYLVQKSGDFKVHATLHGQNLRGSPYSLLVAPAEVLPVRCEARGVGIRDCIAGEDAKFTIVARDEFKNQLQAGGCKFDVSVRGPVNMTAQVRDMRNGLYECVWRTSKAGIYFVSVTLYGVDIAASPFRVVAEAGPASPKGCYVVSGAIDGGYVGTECCFTIQSCDCFGNRRKSHLVGVMDCQLTSRAGMGGGDTFAVFISGTAVVEAVVRCGTVSAAHCSPPQRPANWAVRRFLRPTHWWRLLRFGARPDAGAPNHSR